MKQKMLERIQEIFQESIAVKQQALADNLDKIQQAVEIIGNVLKGGNKIIVFGNGGSAADSQHIAAEFIGRFQKERQALPAIALSTDTSILTALANDYGFDIVFSRQIEGLGEPGDVALGISTSGNSRNVVSGIQTAKAKGLKTIVLTGQGGGNLLKVADLCMSVPSKVTARIQESHITIAHVICELIEEQF
ncbi:MAG: D-sedoheptulose 7-phosphate isomerase [Candidatus Omnitrophota bacterium]